MLIFCVTYTLKNDSNNRYHTGDKLQVYPNYNKCYHKYDKNEFFNRYARGKFYERF